MKHLLIVAASVLVLAGCATNDGEDMGAPGHETYNDRSGDSASDNIRDVGRQNSPSSPFTSGNGSGNF